MNIITQQSVDGSASSVSNQHPDYNNFIKSWSKIRDCLAGEDMIKSKTVQYLPRPAGMSGEYADAYDSYIERAHFPLVTGYALSGALGVIITKMPEFNVPPQLEYILKTATKDGKTLQQLFLDIIIEIFQTGRVPLLVDVLEGTNEFRFVQYKAENFINWKTSAFKAIESAEDNLILGVLKEAAPTTTDIFSHVTDDFYRVLFLNENGDYETRLYGDGIHIEETAVVPTHMGTTLQEIPLVLAGSINNSFEMQPIPLVAVANCSIQIYRKEADLANSEFLSCNPTLVLVGASNDDDLPNVVGSSVMMVIPNESARVFYTKTDTAALSHVKNHINDLYEEAIRHGVSILDARKGVESAEALRIRQSTQSASIYSIYLSAINTIKKGLQIMCTWSGANADDIIIDAPSTLVTGLADASVLKEVVEGFGKGVVPLPAVHSYLISSDLLDSSVGFEEYIEALDAYRDYIVPEKELGNEELVDEDGNVIEKGETLDEDVSINENGTILDDEEEGYDGILDEEEEYDDGEVDLKKKKKRKKKKKGKITKEILKASEGKENSSV